MAEGSPGHECVVEREGDPEVRRGGERVGELHGGDHFGEAALFDHAPRNASIVATTAAVMEVIRRRELSDLLAGSPDLVAEVRSTVVRRQADA